MVDTKVCLLSTYRWKGYLIDLTQQIQHVNKSVHASFYLLRINFYGSEYILQFETLSFLVVAHTPRRNPLKKSGQPVSPLPLLLDKSYPCLVSQLICWQVQFFGCV